MLVSKFGLDCQPYHKSHGKTTWAYSSLRNWLNSSFLKAAFTTDELNVILKATVDNSSSQGNSNWNTQGGENTTDRIFLLSYAEADQYFDSNDDRIIQATEYAKGQGAHINSSNDSCWWWLRSPGSNQDDAADVGAGGTLGYNTAVNYDGDVVRPALWINHEQYNEIETLEYSSNLQKAVQEKWSNMVGSANTVTFGCYEQDNDFTNGPEPIEWIVLDVQDGKSLLISKYALESRWFSTREGAHWDNSFIRDWLNSAFLHNAFAPEERAAIILSDIKNGYEEGGTGADQGHSTKDKIFFLSYAEVWRYFPTEESRLCEPTACTSQFTTVIHKNCGWWLRSVYSKKSGYRGGYVTTEGILDYSSVGEIGVRPAIWVWNEPEKLEELSQGNQLEDEKLTVGSSVFFGQYEQDGNQLNGKEPIEWKVLNIEDNRCQLISKYILSQKNYEEHHFDEMAWESSSLCEWLNKTFSEEAFTEEQAESVFELPENEENAQRIKVTLLEQTEYNKYLIYSPDRICDASRVGASNGKLGGLVGNGGIWWLQTPDLRKGHYAFCVNGSGALTSQHVGVGAGVRPVIWVDLNSVAFLP